MQKRYKFVWVSICALVAMLMGSVHAAPLNKHSGGKPVVEYLPADTKFDPAIPTPESYLGANIGTWHVRHDQLVGYMKLLAEKSDRISIEETGRTHENRPLVLLTITAPKNQGNIDAMRKSHINTITSGAPTDKNAPLFFYMGYSIHGNESSGSNAALAIAYYLAAGQSEQVNTLLSDNVVLLDPSLNPDGLARFAQWANMHKSYNLVSDSSTREHDEGWPSGRTNHYWFDLNRDWLLLTHPESRARIKQFQKWRPHILTDFHEMGTNSSYFFQPGVRSRKNPLTPEGNVTLTERLAEYHARALDARGELYFSEEGFDDFYAGKGSTYPDLHGSIGILFEQASSRGHLQESINGELAFSRTIQNQVTTSLSTFKGALANKPAILKYQNAFYSETKNDMGDDKTGGYLLRLPDDKARVEAMLSILDQHGISYASLTSEASVDDEKFAANTTLAIPTSQPQYRLIKSIFSTQTSFPDNTFYDVSNWNLPLAFNVDYSPLSQREFKRLKTSSGYKADNESSAVVPNAYAYAFEWHSYNAPAMMQALLSAGANVRSASEPFTATMADGSSKAFGLGSIVIPAGLTQPDNLVSLLERASKDLSVRVYSLKTGLTQAGIDLGSRSMEPIALPRVLLVGGENTSEYEIGEIWHYLDTRVGMPVSLVEQRKLDDMTLSDYTHIIFASGSYVGMSKETRDKLGEWVSEGGVLIGQKSALQLFAEEKWLDIDILSKDKLDAAFNESQLSYGDRRALYAKKLIAGSVYEAKIDPTHPLFFGYTNKTLPFFKTNNMIVKSDNSPFSTVAKYAESPLKAGYSADELVKMIATTTAVRIETLGDGVVIGFVDNVNFRGYWYGTSKLMGNAIFQSPLMH